MLAETLASEVRAVPLIAMNTVRLERYCMLQGLSDGIGDRLGPKKRAVSLTRRDPKGRRRIIEWMTDGDYCTSSHLHKSPYYNSIRTSSLCSLMHRRSRVDVLSIPCGCIRSRDSHMLQSGIASLYLGTKFLSAHRAVPLQHPYLDPSFLFQKNIKQNISAWHGFSWDAFLQPLAFVYRCVFFAPSPVLLSGHPVIDRYFNYLFTNW